MSYPQPPQPAYTPPPPAKKKRTGLKIALMVLAAFVLVIIVAAITSPKPTTTAGTTTPAGSPAGTSQLAAPAPTTTSAVPTTPAAPAGPATTMTGDGTYVVGTDIQPGTYHTAGAAPGIVSNCYWEREKDTSGQFESILANNNGTGPSTVTIAKTDGAFKTQGCQAWALVK